ncbi:MAG: anti-sigma factor [Bryobacteraceae bacterium]|nr:anti-sigma factor [Bryobacteraceae bacterium]
MLAENRSHRDSVNTNMMPERLAELLALRAIAGLSPEEARELAELLRQHPEVKESDFEPLPDLRDRLLRRAAKERRWGRGSAWMVAVVLALAFFLATWESAETRLDHHPATRRLRWQGSLAGEAVWNAEQQSGYLLVSGLPPNDARQSVYQLWIFDRARDSRYPVDGGVFSVDTHGETRIPIRAALPVRDATGFAITREAPGGVVVSERKELLATATPASQ